MRDKTMFFFVFSICITGLWYQSAAVSPSRVYFNADQGQTPSRRITVTNNSESPQTFTVSFADFTSPAVEGKTELIDPADNPQSATQWLSASPWLLELAAGESRDVEMVIQVPNIR